MTKELTGAAEMLAGHGYTAVIVKGDQQGRRLKEPEDEHQATMVAEVERLVTDAGVPVYGVYPAVIERGFNSAGARLGNRRAGSGDRVVAYPARIEVKVPGGYECLYVVAGP